MRLLLFDIDGTLLTCGGQTRPHFAAALTEVFGTTGAIDAFDFSGRTDPSIVHALMEGAGISRDVVAAGVDGVRDRYLDRLEANLRPEGVTVYRGVRELLAALTAPDGPAAKSDAAVGLLTGNWERGAGIKLGSVGLRDPFAFGSFGDGATDRRMLPPVALERARGHHGRDFAAEDTWIVGDSLLDVDCARAHGLRCLAVATGRTPAAALAAAGADAVVTDFGDTAAVLDRLLG